MKISHLAAAAAALSLATVPAVSAAAQAQAPVSGENSLGGGSDTIIGVIAIAVLAAFIAITVSLNNEDDPVSP